MAQKYKDTIDCLIKELDSSAIKSCLFQSEKNNSTYKVRTISVDKRIEADKDYSSIIQSGYFRRLEDKTQVFALAKDNHRRTRLTHSIEVSSVGEQLGNNCIDIIRRSYLVGYKGKERDSLIKIINTIPLILRNACLVHDLGNPPFGHKGEFMIGEWIKNNLSRYTVYFQGLLKRKWI